MDGHDDFADWSSFREQRGGRDDRRTPDQYSYDFDGDSRVPAPRSGGDSRYASLAELSSGRERADDREWDRGDDWDRGRDRYQAPADPDFAPRGPRSAPPVDPDFAPRGARSGEPLPPPDPGFAPRVQRPDVPPMPMSPMSPAGPPMSPAGPRCWAARRTRSSSRPRPSTPPRCAARSATPTASTAASARRCWCCSAWSRASAS
ncbi:hypothetical protein ACFQY4_39895 [Catellatospora bangladeshensis]|uniref:hypothetical protein n=1 Tax=Catellatospora bangladeshensis TaxID=310355 RepID=UPI003614AEC5